MMHVTVGRVAAMTSLRRCLEAFARAIVLVLCWMVGVTAQQRLGGATPPRPNIVFIVADDLGWNDIGYHNPQIQTPNLDRLAREGVRFNQHYVFPTCSPSRVALLTGRNPARFGVFAPLEATTTVRP